MITSLRWSWSWSCEYHQESPKWLNSYSTYKCWSTTKKYNDCHCGLSVCSIAGGELFERIVDDNFEHTEPASVRYMQQILEGIAYMHQQNIIHLDLKPENIVCVDTSGTSIKIIDFGLASRIGM